MIQIPKYAVKDSSNKVVAVIAAKNKKQAWAKFCRQYFGPLKPASCDYFLREAK